MGFPFDVAVGDCCTQAELLDGDAGAGQVLELVGRYRRNRIALLRRRYGPLFRGQPRKGFTHRAGAKTEAASNVADDDLGARRQPAFEDFGQQRLVSEIGLRRGRVRWSELVHQNDLGRLQSLETRIKYFYVAKILFMRD